MKLCTECNMAQLTVDLLDGKTAVFPTETSYGLGCDATNPEAVQKIFSIKGRPKDKPLLIVVPNITMAQKYLQWNDVIDQLAERYWPGPLTIVGKYNPSTPALVPGVVSTDGSVAVRVSAFPFLQSITQKINRPLVATSGNISDAGDVYDVQQIIHMFDGRDAQPNLILDYGILPKMRPTTIVRSIDNSFEVLRQGEIVVSLN